MSKKIFIDTSAWIMLLNQSEHQHEEAVAIYSTLDSYVSVVSNLVIGETYTWLRRKSSFKVALDFVKALERKVELQQVEVIYSGRILEQQALKLLEQYADQHFSYADAVSFCIIKNMSIEKAFAYDRHFTTAGIELINDSYI